MRSANGKSSGRIIEALERFEGEPQSELQKWYVRSLLDRYSEQSKVLKRRTEEDVKYPPI